MKITKLFPALLSIAFLALFAMSALAQVGRIEGEVLKDGTNEPIADAEVEIVRTDIKGTYTVKTNKKG
ncbi:MAG TPA: carboxypeptidase-like regulatory domain-containing protein, partial [Blastocatellia bacterium]|nr:carboxypeptidase-like regulatory domain-containing protein [Blastocatellia bacterium]